MPLNICCTAGLVVESFFSSAWESLYFSFISEGEHYQIHTAFLADSFSFHSLKGRALMLDGAAGCTSARLLAVLCWWAQLPAGFSG